MPVFCHLITRIHSDDLIYIISYTEGTRDQSNRNVTFCNVEWQDCSHLFRLLCRTVSNTLILNMSKWTSGDSQNK